MSEARNTDNPWSKEWNKARNRIMRKYWTFENITLYNAKQRNGVRGEIFCTFLCSVFLMGTKVCMFRPACEAFGD